MEFKKSKKLSDALKKLRKSLQLLENPEVDEEVSLLAIHKAFEIAVEYLWKDFKKKVENEGLEAPSPKEAVRQAAKIHLIDDPKKWIDFINLRNDSVHDYFGANETYQTNVIREFLKLAESL